MLECFFFLHRSKTKLYLTKESRQLFPLPWLKSVTCWNFALRWFNKSSVPFSHGTQPTIGDNKRGNSLRYKKETAHAFMRNPITPLLSQTLLVYLSHIMQQNQDIGCNILSLKFTKPVLNLCRHVQWSTQSLTLASRPEQIGWCGSKRPVRLAKRLYNASIPSSLIERAMGHQLVQASLLP